MHLRLKHKGQFSAKVTQGVKIVSVDIALIVVTKGLSTTWIFVMRPR